MKDLILEGLINYLKFAVKYLTNLTLLLDLDQNEQHELLYLIRAITRSICYFENYPKIKELKNDTRRNL